MDYCTFQRVPDFETRSAAAAQGTLASSLACRSECGDSHGQKEKSEALSRRDRGEGISPRARRRAPRRTRSWSRKRRSRKSTSPRWANCCNEGEVRQLPDLVERSPLRRAVSVMVTRARIRARATNRSPPSSTKIDAPVGSRSQRNRCAAGERLRHARPRAGTAQARRSTGDRSRPAPQNVTVRAGSPAATARTL